jgi:2-oxoglutarate ferredoxin oxidoreductase subunit delta
MALWRDPFGPTARRARATGWANKRLARQVMMERTAQSETGPANDSVSFLPVVITSHRCKGCRLCVVTCPHDALALDEATVNALGYHPATLVDAAACTSCALCARVCPEGAFTVYARPRAPR